MIADGERLKALVNSARKRVLLCAPFIKAQVLRIILSGIDDAVSVRIVTRWRPAEVAAGVSDLEVFELANERPNTQLELLDDLHAKLFLSDDEGLAGSANLTATALGWAKNSNVELLLPISQSTQEVTHLLRRLECAKPATYAIRSAIEAEAAALGVVRFDEGEDVSDQKGKAAQQPWLPSCAAPDSLRAIYDDATTATVAEGTREDGLADLRDLHIPRGLSVTEFEKAVRDSLLLMPAFNRIIDHVPQGLTDTAAIALVSELRPDLPRSSVALQWRIVRDWVTVFFQQEFEVAPESFITRLRPR